MGQCNIAGNGQAQADAAGRRVARFIQAHKWPKYVTALVVRNARPIIIDNDSNRFGGGRNLNPAMHAVAQAIRNNIAQRPPHALRTQPQRQRPRYVAVYSHLIVPECFGHRPYQGHHIDHLGRLCNLIASEIQVALDHAFHIGDILAQPILIIAVAQHLHLNAHTAEGCAQIVANGG